jgi:hypothetical protein
MRKAVIPVIAFAVAAPMVLVANVPEAQAATSCYASTCTGKLAANTTCVSDGEVVEQANIGSIGYVQLKYSPSCRATWARVIEDIAAVKPSWAASAVVRSTSSSIPLEGCNGSGAAGTGCNTPMIDDLSPLTSYAEGSVPGVYENGVQIAYSGTTSPPF